MKRADKDGRKRRPAILLAYGLEEAVTYHASTTVSRRVQYAAEEGQYPALRAHAAEAVR